MKYICSLLLTLFTMNLSAQSFDKEKLDLLFDRIDENRKGMGTISLWHGGKEIYSRSIGMASIDPDIQALASTRYGIGSISKTMTAALIMRLIEEGKLSLDTKLSEFYPEIKHAEKITIKQLLSHRSGIFNFTNAIDYMQWMEKPISEEDLVKKIVEYGTAFEPGEKYEYSNSNYALLSFIAEKASEQSKSFAELLQEHICKPCDLKTVALRDGIDVNDQDAQSYVLTDDWQQATETDPSVPLGAGGISATATDLNRFLHCLFGGELVSEESLEKMMEVGTVGYGLGVMQVPFYDKKAYGHTGGIDGFRSNGFYFPKEKLAVTYLSNGVNMPLNDILIGILSIYFGKDYEVPTFEEMEVAAEELKKYEGIYGAANFPMKITVAQKDGQLTAQATGQSAFPLEPYETHLFKFDPAGIKVEFLPEKNQMILRQAGGEYVLDRE